MAKKMTRKDLLKSEDEFLSFSSRAMSFFRDHIRGLKIAGVVIAAACVVFLGTTAFFRHVNNKGQEAYNAAYSAMAEQIKPEMAPEKVREVHDLFSSVVEDHGMSRAAGLALPQLAFLKFLDGKYDDALRIYSEFGEKRGKESDFATLCALAVAACHEANGEADKAIRELAPIAGNRDNRFRETALFTLARLHRLSGDEKRAAELAGEFIQEFPGSQFEPIVKTILQSASTVSSDGLG